MELGEVYVKIGADIVPLEKALGKARTVTKNTTEQMRAQMKTLGKGMIIAGAAITAAFALTVRSAISFQKELAQVSTMLDESAMKIMPQYKSELLKMSVAFGEATGTLSRGLYDILSASIPPTQALEVLAVAAKAATAGITDTGVASDAITTILNSYGFSADKAGEVSDKLFAIVKRGKLTFNELAPAIGKSAAMAAKSGLSFDELGAMIATLTRAGIRTDEAMTSINGVLRAFLKPSDDAKEAAAEFGLTLNTTTLRTEGLRGSMDKLRNATAEQLAQIFPNIRGLKGLMAALGDAEGYTKDYELMLNSAGLTQIAFEKQSATLGFKIDQLKKSFNVIAITIGDVLIPIVQNIVEWVIKFTSKIKELADAHPGLVNLVVKLGAALGVFTGAGGVLILGVLYFTNLKTAMVGMSKTITTIIIPTLFKLKVALAGVAGQSLLVLINIILWSEVWLKWQKIASSTHKSLQDVNDAQAITLKMQEEAAKKFRVTLEVFQEWQKSGEGVRDVSEDVAAVMDKLAARRLFKEQIKELAEFEEKIRGMEIELSAMTIGSKQWQLLSQEIANTKEEMKDLGDAMDKIALAEGIVENAKIIKTTVADLMFDIDSLIKGFELTGKSVEESVTHYSLLVEKLNAVDVILQTELILLEEGTEAYKKKQVEILENAKAIKDVGEELKKLIEPLKGLELIAAKMAILGDSTDDTKAKIELLTEKAVLLQQALDEAIPDTEAWWEAKAAFEENQVAIEDLKEKLTELTEEEKEAIAYAEKLADTYKTLEDRIFELTHTAMEVNIRKLDEQRQAYLEAGAAIGIVNEWHSLEIAKLNEVNQVIDKNIDKVEQSIKVTQFLGKSYKMVVEGVREAGVALNQFTIEALAAAITVIKMHYYPEIARLTGLIREAYHIRGLAERYMFDLKEVTKAMGIEIRTLTYGFEEYQDVLASLTSQYGALGSAASKAGAAMGDTGWGVKSYETGIRYVPRTGIYKLHEGERVTPANQNTYNNSFSPILNMTVQGGGSPNRIAQEVENVLYDMGRQFKRKGFEIIPGRG